MRKALLRSSKFLVLVLAGVPATSWASADFVTLSEVKEASQFYNQPYVNGPNDKHNKTTSGNTTVYRPNHGLAHAVRKAAVTDDLTQVLLKNHRQDAVGSWLSSMLQSDPQFGKKMIVGAMMSRAGRLDEGESETSKNFAASAADFRKVAEDAGLSESNLHDIAVGIMLDGHAAAPGEQNVEDQTKISHLLRVAHLIELNRMNLSEQNFSGMFHSMLPELSGGELQNLYDRDSQYLVATGDLMHSRGLTDITDPARFGSEFYAASLNPGRLLDDVNHTHGN